VTKRERQPPHLAARLALAERVIAARYEAKLTQEEVAHATGMARSYMSTTERGQANLALDHLVRLASVLGVEPG